MRQSIASIWSGRSLNDPSARIDRFLADRVERLSAGLFVQRDFSAVASALVITRGRGKFLRVKHSFGSSVEIPDALGASLREATNDPDVSVSRITQLIDDLTGIQAQAADQLKQQAGKYVDRLLTVSVLDPGLWTTDFDGQRACAPLCNATSLASRSGITVIDAFAQRDIDAGGNGSPLEAIPLWLLFSDRHEKIARTNVAFVSCDRQTDYFRLPASDGLDSDLPALEHTILPGTAFLIEALERVLATRLTENDVKQLYSDHLVDDELSLRLKSAWLDGGRSEFEKVACSYINNVNADASVAGKLLCTTIEWICKHIARTIRAGAKATGGARQQVLLSSCDVIEACLLNRLAREFDSGDVFSKEDAGFKGLKLNAVVAAILGMMNVDQFPANVPWLTGASSQRILGRLTPGNPSNWRQLLRDMADFQPPAMKLRDAI
ncbi:MAG: anhydro-N-acetylmuramic acid kinase [Planctomycetota bacterium]